MRGEGEKQLGFRFRLSSCFDASSLLGVQPSRAFFSKLLVTALGDGDLAGDHREDVSDLASKGNQNGDGDNGNEGEDEGVFHEGLSLSALHALAGNGVSDDTFDHCEFTPFRRKFFEEKRARASSCLA
jgi:hypothetical protein